MAELRVPVPGGDVVAWRDGAGPPVLVLHGGPGLSDYTAPIAAELDGFEVVRFQQRGVAPSTAAGPFDVERHVGDAVAVLDAAGVDRAYVVGHSWGGHLALHLAVRHPDRLQGLVLADPLGAVGDGGAADLGRILGERMSPNGATRLAELAESEDSSEAALESLAILWPGYFASREAATPMPELVLSTECNNRTFESIRAHLERGTLEMSLPAVRLPAVFLLGAASPIPPEHGEATAALIPGAECVVEPDCGHFVWLERPGALRATLDRVLVSASTGRTDAPRS